jgi:adenosine deaminase
MALAHFGMDAADLLADTRTAISAAFVDDETRARLLARLDQHSVGEAA